MKTVQIDGELFVCVIADRDDQIGRSDDIDKALRLARTDWKMATPGCCDSIRVDSGCGVGARRSRWHRATATPDGSRKLAARRVLRTDEHDAVDRFAYTWYQPFQGGMVEPQVSSSAVTLRPQAPYQTGALENFQVVREQIRRHRKGGLEFGRRSVFRHHLVDNRQPARIRERRMNRGTSRPIQRILNVH